MSRKQSQGTGRSLNHPKSINKLFVLHLKEQQKFYAGGIQLDNQ